jgi:hypothetical protein
MEERLARRFHEAWSTAEKVMSRNARSDIFSLSNENTPERPSGIGIIYLLKGNYSMPAALFYVFFSGNRPGGSGGGN